MIGVTHHLNQYSILRECRGRGVVWGRARVRVASLSVLFALRGIKAS